MLRDDDENRIKCEINQLNPNKRISKITQQNQRYRKPVDDDKNYEIIVSNFTFFNKSGEILSEFVNLNNENLEWYSEQGF